MKGGANIIDQQTIRRYVEDGGNDAAAIADELLITEDCAQSWMDFFSNKNVVDVAEEIIEETPAAKVSTKEKARKNIEEVEDNGLFE